MTTPSLTRSPRPFCAYCSTGLRELCPTRRAIEAGLPGLSREPTEVLAARIEADRLRGLERMKRYKAKHRRAHRIAPTPTRLEILRAFRAGGCRLDRTAKILRMRTQTLNRHLDEGLRETLRRIREASRENP